MGRNYTHVKSARLEKPYKCEVCLASKCEVCLVRFTISSNVKKLSRVLKGERLYKCQIYSAKYSRSNVLKNHSRVHCREKPYKCEICLTRFSLTCEKTVNNTTLFNQEVSKTMTELNDYTNIVVSY